MEKINYTSKKMILAYFSGTGCTKMVCDCFEKGLLEAGVDCVKVNMAVCEPFDIGEADTIIIFSPVYAFRLSSIAETWVKNLPRAENKSAIVISVSGGGEISPNTACRIGCKRVLKRKGYNLIYEKMIVMPSNFAVQAEENMNLALLLALPHKVNKIILDILSGKKNIEHPKFIDRVFAAIGKAEHFGARFFGRFIRVSQKCNKCGVCVSNCPQKNIRIINKVPKFGFQCIWCLKCIYNCSSKALSPGILKFSVLKSGFNLKKMNEKAMSRPVSTEYCHSENMLWQGVADYLNDDDLHK
ncbi:EFR1 family ferrodoxin [Konateibacter massiliensis]|uniref:EFR1 family ferrodoxin n=1 Tax=Konateibacter massiliensis TaxID=2002841 RepID=UPI000C150AF4|nr:EFR1 family ferrodoxin [Konateibacter massiliensis]